MIHGLLHVAFTVHTPASLAARHGFTYSLAVTGLN